MTKPYLIVLIFLFCATGLFAQAPIISYVTPQTYTVGTAIPNLLSVNVGGTIPVNLYGQVSTFAGTGTVGSVNGTGTAASFSGPNAVAVDAAGNVYIADGHNNLIRKITPAGVVTTLAGSGSAGSANGTGAAASFNNPEGLAVDISGNVYVADHGNNLIRKITPDGVVTTFAGNGVAGSQNGPAATASFNAPIGLAVNPVGDVFVADEANNFIKKISSGVVTTYAGKAGATGTGVQGSDNGTAATATFFKPTGLALDASGNLYVTDLGNNLVRKIDPSGAVTTFAGNGSAGSVNGPAASASFNAPYGISADPSGNVFVSTTNDYVIRKITPAGAVSTIAGNAFSGSNNGVGSAATFNLPYGVAADVAGNIYVADYSNNLIRKISSTGYAISPVLPSGLNIDGIGKISGSPSVVSPATNYTITAYNDAGSGSAVVNITTVNPSASSPPTVSYTSPQTYTAFTPIVPLAPVSTGVAAAAYSNSAVLLGSGFNKPNNVALDATGNIYVADAGNNAVKKIPVGGGAPVTIGSGFNNPTAVAVDAAGNVYVADFGNRVVKKIPVGGGAPVTIGSGFRFPYDVEVDAAGNVYVGDNNSATVPVGGASNVFVKVIPANGDAVFNISGGYYFIKEIAFDGAGNSYVADANGSSFIEGTSNGLHGLSDYIFNSPNFSFNLTGLAMDATGNVYVADGSNNTVSEVPANNNNIKSPVGPVFGAVAGIKADAAGNIFVADANSTSIAEVKPIGGYFISPALPLGLKFDNATGIISGTPTVASPVTSYTITAYNSAGVSTKTAITLAVSISLPDISYIGPQIYAIGTVIPQLAPVSKKVAAADYSKPSVISSGLSNPYAVAVDANNNVYFTDTGNGSIKRIPAGGGSAVTIGSGYTNPQGIAVDAAGNIYVTDFGTNGVYKMPAGGSSHISIGSGFSQPINIAADKAGNVYVGNNSTNRFIKIPADGSPQITLPSGVTSQGGITLDDAGNFYESSQLGGLIAEIPADGSATNNFYAYLGSKGLALDAANDFYLVDDVGNQLIKAKRQKIGQNVNIIDKTIYNNFYQPTGVAMGTDGILYVADKGNNEIKQVKPNGGYYISPSLPAGLVFDNNTGIISGIPTAKTPLTSYKVTAYNSSGSTSTTVTISVAPVLPTITAGSVTGTITACVGNASASPNIQQFTVSGSSLTADVIVTAPSGFEVSTTQSGNYASTLTLTQLGGAINSTVIYVRSASSNPVGNISGNVVLSSTGVTSQNVAVSGTVNALPVVGGTILLETQDGVNVQYPAFTGASSYTWVNDNPSIGLAATGTGNIPVFMATNTSNSPIIARVTVTPLSAAGCSGNSVTFTITVLTSLNLATNNFKLAITSATCKGNSDGSVAITATQSESYTATITGNGLNISNSFTTTTAINNLAAGTYHVCITVAGQPDFSQCYDAVVTEPKDLSVYSVINTDNSLTLSLSGGTQYNIQVNGQTYTTTNNSITLPMAQGNNDITVTTDRLCQGSYKRLINISGNITPYPDPFQNTLSLNIGNTVVNNLNVEIHNVSDGKLVFAKQYANQAGVLQLDLTNLQGGVYALHLSMDNSDKIFKIIKK